MDALPPELEAERKALLREIDAVFDFTVRGDGTSWTEAAVLDNPFATVDERQAGREMDRDCDWRELIDDPPWDDGRSVLEFGFLDALGFRYYLAPAMVRGLLGSYLWENIWELGLYLISQPHGSPFYSEYPKQWSALNRRQAQLVARFVRLMNEVDQLHGQSKRMWSQSLSHWRQFL